MDDQIIGMEAADEQAVPGAEAAGFDVNDSVEIGDLSDVQERTLIPEASNVLLRVKEASIRNMAEGKLKALSLSLTLDEGIEGGKYAGMSVYSDNIWIYADTTVYIKDFWTTRKYLGTLKSLLKALGMTDVSVINDAVLVDMVGKLVVGKIVQENVEAKNDATGEYVPTGEKRNKAKYFTAPRPEQLA